MAIWLIFSRHSRYIKILMNIFLFKQQHVNLMLCITYAHTRRYIVDYIKTVNVMLI